MPTETRNVTRLRRGAIALVLLPLLSTACGGEGDGEATATTTGTAGTVEIRLLAFKPGSFTVDAGDQVTWKQNDIGAHTVTSGTVEQGSAGVTPQPDGRFDSGDIPEGETFEFTFTDAGTYPYFCRLHPATMRGEILVR